MKISIIIAVYKDSESLKVVLESLYSQSYKEFEVIIAEDCEENKMKELLGLWKEKIKIKHVFQEDKGFRKNKILNKAIKVSEGEYFIFLDGDCMVHSDFVLEYSKKVAENNLLVGRRVMLSKKLTESIKNNFYIPSLIQILLSKSSYKEEGIKLFGIFANKNVNGLIGSNFGISKELVYKINGFDEDYEAPGIGEDDDILMRIKKIGNINIISVRNRAIQFHLEHSRKGQRDLSMNLFQKKKSNNSYICKNGLEKLED